MKYTLSVILLFFAYGLFGQNTIRGKVINENDEELVSATVVLMEDQDSTMVAFCLTNSKGEYKLNDIDSGGYILQVSFISYSDQLRDIELVDTKGSHEENDIVMYESTEILNEITISADHIPMGVRGDTISYNASAFKTRPNATVEDLLKKLPGIEVERNGNIKAQGEDVENVLVDGKEFFGGDPKMATKNLAAEAVDKVEVYDKQSEIAEFTGVDDGEEEKTINLQLKEDHKNGGFGTIGGELGDEDNYETKLNYYRFNPKMQASAVFSANNVNKETFSFNDRIEFMGGIANVMQAGGMNIMKGGMNSRGLNESLSTGINFNYDLSSKLEWRSHYLRNRNENDLLQQSYSNNFTDDFSYLTQDSLMSNNLFDGHRINARLNYKLTPFTELTFRNIVSWDDNSLDRINTVNYSRDSIEEGNSLSDFSSRSDRLEYESRTMWKQKFAKKGRNLISSFYLNRSEEESVDSVLVDNRVINNVFDLDQNQYFGSEQDQHSISTNYTEPLGSKLFLGFEYQYGNNTERPYRNYFDLDNGQEIRNEDLSSNFEKKYLYNVGGLSLRRTTKRFKSTLGISLQRTSLQGSVNSEELLIDSSYTNILPSLSTEFNFKGGKSLNIDYYTSVNSPDLQQMLPFPNNSTANYQYIGNPALVPEYQHRLGINFHSYDNFNFSSMWVHANFSYTANKIVNKRSIDEFFFNTVESINTDNQKDLSLYFNYSRPFNPLKLKYSFRSRYRYSSYDSFINNLSTDVTDDNLNIRLSISNKKTDKIFVETGFAVDRSSRKYGIDESFNQNFFNTDAFLDLEYYISNTWTFGTSFSYRSYSSESFSDNPSFSIWNMYLSKLIFNETMEIKVYAFDLLSQNLSYFRSGGVNYIQESYYNQLGSYFSLGLKYNIGKTRSPGGIQVDVVD